MNHFYSLTEFADFLKAGGTFAEGRKFAFNGVWVTIGSFDGVHRGHQAILSRMAREAHAAGKAAVVVTFHPHPVVVLRGDALPSKAIYLNSPDERAHFMHEQGVDAVITMTFNRDLAAMSAEDFMENLSAHTGLEQLWVGSDFALGRNRQGDIPTLREIGNRLGYTVQEFEVIGLENGSNEKISSSTIREKVRRGEVAEAGRMLGRPYRIEGTVVHGEARGRVLGFPTANVDYWADKVTPALGVYATWAWIGQQRYPSVTNVGLNPTFDTPLSHPRVEAYLIDFSADIYDQEIRIEFLEFLRPEQRYDNIEALIEQMKLDTQRAREVLTHAT